ncbi:MAG: DEAD/DEAH box helicase [Candidatus Lokiarchaeota archaeon]|nr:DEAD/DEAH box helicase [Candidatus Lokiarchaeota archaeon]
MELRFHKGTIEIQGDYSVPHARWDRRRDTYRAEAFYYRDIKEYLETSNIPYQDNVLKLRPSRHLSSSIALRPYQRKACERWLKVKRGSMIMPTGSGKTILAVKLIEKLNTNTFIAVPTLDLVNQWKEELENSFSTEIGEYTGNKKALKPITVATYDSAYLNAEHLGDQFEYIIFDEVHHLSSEGYIQIAEMFAAPFRLGLTATYERSDGRHKELQRVLGGIIYEIEANELTGSYLADYNTKQIPVSFTPQEREEYEQTYDIFRHYLISRKIRLRSPADFKKIVLRSGRDPAARKAILARNKAEKMAFNSQNKLDKLGELLDKRNRTIIFTKYNQTVYKIARCFLIPCITHKTRKQEREDILDKFKEGKYRAIVSSRVLNEGINVPEANVGIILSGTGSSREYIQRLGRLLRPRPNKKAVLYELITKNTMEVKTSARRRS